MAEFTLQAAERIAKATRAVESMHINPRARTRRWPVSPDSTESTAAQLVQFAAADDFSYGDLIEGAAIVDWWPDGSDDPDPESAGVDVINQFFYGDEDSQGLAMVMRDGVLVALNVDCQEEITS